MRSNTTPIDVSNERTPALMVIVVFTLFLANLFTQYPGVTNWDSDEQYAQAVSGQFNDWHPPIMARLWSVLRLVAEGSGPLFAVHVCFYWLGFGLIAVALSRIGRNRAAWAVIAVGAFPPFLVVNIQILKD